MRTFESAGWLEGHPVLENWLAQRGVDITNGNTVASVDYEFKTVRSSVKVFKGTHARLGWFELGCVELSWVGLGLSWVGLSWVWLYLFAFLFSFYFLFSF
jgi:hypothetical protein